MKHLILPFILVLGITMNILAQNKPSKEMKVDSQNTDQNIQQEAACLRIINAPGKISSEDYFNYAMALKVNGKYDEVRKWMDKFCELKPTDLRAMDYIANGNDLTNLLRDHGNYTIEHLTINSKAQDFGASYYKNKIVFASTRKSFRMMVRNNNWGGKPFWNLFVSEIVDNQLKSPVLFDKRLNGKWQNGPASFSNDGSLMVFTRNHYKDKKKQKTMELQLFFSSFIDGKWSEPEPFYLNDPTYSIGYPCLTEDGKTMYFASDMPGGFGKSDIYKITKDKNGAWGKPRNMGDKINTEGDETYPFFEENNNILFFSSNGRFGLGGLDIFVYAINDSGFGRPYNVGAPLNSRYDDFAAIVDSKINTGYFTSNRSGGNGSDDIYSVKFGDPDVFFTVHAPLNVPTEPRIRETFPLCPYLYFKKESTEIANCYVLLKKDQVKDFMKEQLKVSGPKDLSGRSKRQMVAYYTLLNILGDRMVKNPSSSITLVGSSEKNTQDGREMAISVKEYLIDLFGVETSRISIKGRVNQKMKSEQPGGNIDLEFLREEKRTVSIESESPALLKEYQSGPDTPLNAVGINGIQQAPLESDVSFQVENGNNALSSWSMEIRDEKDFVQKYGPYYLENITIPGKYILGTRPQGDYKITMIGVTKNGKTIRRESSVHMTLWTPPTEERSIRFSIIFEFDHSRAIPVYEKYLTDIVAPQIPINGKVIIHGHTDIIGNDINNQQLSNDRANEVRSILEKSLLKANRTDATFEISAFGENQEFSPFENKSPEERAYNRTVILDILPAEKVL